MGQVRLRKVQGSKFKVIGRPVVATIRQHPFGNLRVGQEPMSNCLEKFLTVCRTTAPGCHRRRLESLRHQSFHALRVGQRPMSNCLKNQGIHQGLQPHLGDGGMEGVGVGHLAVGAQGDAETGE